MNIQLAYGITAFIQDRAASLAALDALPTISVRTGISLLHQLEDEQVDTPTQLAFDISRLLDLLDPTSLLEARDPLRAILDIFVGRPGEAIRRLVEAKNPADIRAAIEGFLHWDPVRDLEALGRLIGPFIRRQVSIALSLIITLNNLRDPQLWRGIPDAYTKYFFGAQGYITVDGIPILPPMHFGDMSLFDPATGNVQLDSIKGLLAEKSAERYVRDLIRITVEAADDARYDNLPARYAALLSRVGENRKSKATRWFKGISSLAESLVTSAVEEVCLGIAQLQTNALIAASAGTYAGTSARKAAQHVFLRELGV